MGTAIAALLNGRARKVTPSVVRALSKALPRSTILVSDDFDQARRHVRTLIQERPEVILSGGGDGAAMRLLNFWREEGGAGLPTLGILRLGTGNGWRIYHGGVLDAARSASASGAAGNERDARLVRDRGAPALLAADAVPDRRGRHGRARGDRLACRPRNGARGGLANRFLGVTERPLA
jgi:diacylglycerol kinase family enzyme